jgi:AcrR family transcriptional regulator
MSTRPKTTPRRLPTQGRSKVTVEAIVEAAIAVLKKYGLAKTTTNRIAEKAGVSVGTLYQYFPSKEAITSAIIDKHIEGIANLFRPRILEGVGRPFDESIPSLVQLLIELHAVDPNLHRILDEQVPYLGKLDRRHQASLAFQQIIANDYRSRPEQVRVRDPELAAFMIVNLADHIVHQAVNYHPEYLENGRLKEGLSDLIRRYVCPEIRADFAGN